MTRDPRPAIVRLAVVVLAAALVAATRLAPVPRAEVAPSFDAGVPVLTGGAGGSAWFCPGVPVQGAGVASEIVIANPTDQPATGTLTLLSLNREPTTATLVAPARSQVRFDATGGRAGGFTSAVVELSGALVAVEQHLQHPAGRSVAACATGTSDRWIFADGFTGDDSPFQVVLTNPFPTPTIVDVSFVTAEARRAPRQLQGLVLEARSVRVLDLANQGARNETIVAVEVRASAGRLVAGKLQHYLGRGRLGFVAALGASAPSRSWWFPAGEKADGVAEQLVVFNPSDADRALIVAFYPPGGAASVPEPLLVSAPAGRVTVLDTAALPALGEGTYAIAVTTDGASDADGVVIEQVVTRQVRTQTGATTSRTRTSTTAVLGVPGAAIARVWTAPGGVGVTPSDALVVTNTTALPATVTIATVGPAGVVPIAAFDRTSVAAGSSRRFAIPQAAADLQLFVSSDVDVAVERELSRGVDFTGRTAVMALPAPGATALVAPETDTGQPPSAQP